MYNVLVNRWVMMALFVFLQNVVFGGDLQELDATQVRLLAG